MTQLELLAKEVGVSERTLRRSVNQGTLRARRPTPRSLELPLSERQYIRGHWQLLSALRAGLRTAPGVRLAILHGSAARGTDSPVSDIDVAVEMREPSLDSITDVTAKLTAATGRRIDVIRLQDASADPSFLADMLKEGRVLVDRDGLWPDLRRREPEVRQRGREQQRERVRAALAGIDELLAT